MVLSKAVVSCSIEDSKATFQLTPKPQSDTANLKTVESGYWKAMPWPENYGSKCVPGQVNGIASVDH